MLEDIVKEYNACRELFLSGEVSEETWGKYCMAVLDYLMVSNNDVLLRLKER